MPGLIEQLRDETLHGAKDFRPFAIRGKVVDLAVGVVIGTAFGRVISSLVADIIMPPLGLLIGGVKFTHMKITLKAAIATSPAVTINYGSFVQTCTDFLIISLCIFIFVKLLALQSRAHERAARAPCAVMPDAHGHADPVPAKVAVEDALGTDPN